MAQYLVTRNTVFKGKPVNVADIIEAEEKDKDIRFLVAIGKAEKATDIQSKPNPQKRKQMAQRQRLLKMLLLPQVSNPQ